GLPPEHPTQERCLGGLRPPHPRQARLHQFINMDFCRLGSKSCCRMAPTGNRGVYDVLLAYSPAGAAGPQARSVSFIACFASFAGKTSNKRNLLEGEALQTSLLGVSQRM